MRKGFDPSGTRRAAPCTLYQVSNSIRLLHALQGLGKKASLYMYPFEDHGQVAKETLLDNWARWGAWLDKYVKNPAPVTISFVPLPGGLAACATF